MIKKKLNCFKMPGIVYIGGAHIKPPKPLPADLQKFLDESKHGVIYFSFGSVVTAAKLPKDKLEIFLGKNCYCFIIENLFLLPFFIIRLFP